jgi:hypothetical protein
VHFNEAMKAQEATFRASNKRQQDHLGALIARLQQKEPTTEDGERKRALDEQLAEATARLGELRLDAAHKTRQVRAVSLLD